MENKRRGRTPYWLKARRATEAFVASITTEEQDNRGRKDLWHTCSDAANATWTRRDAKEKAEELASFQELLEQPSFDGSTASE